MNGRNVIESLGYTIMKFIMYTVVFSIVYALFGTNHLVKDVLMWCIPLAIGCFLGYLGGRSFTLFAKFRNVILAVLVMFIINIIVALLTKNNFQDNEIWLSTVMSENIAMSFGYVISIKDGLKSNFSAKLNENDEES